MKIQPSRLIAMLALVVSQAASAQPAPRTDIAELRREAMADDAIKSALNDQTRGLEHRLRDDARMTALILKAADAKPGMRVLDIGAGGGYLALLFSRVVGETGHVDIHNTPGWIAQFPSMEPERQRTQITRPNIGWLTASWNELHAPPESYDVIVLGQVWHDVILEAGDFPAIAARLFAMLKPGGRVVVEDHDAIATMHLAQQVNLHRISHGDATGQFLRAGFAQTELILIESAHDDRRFNVFRPGVRGRTDRFIAVFEKPKG